MGKKSKESSLLQRLVEEGVCTAKQMAMWSGRNVKTIYRYLSGERIVPLDVYRATFEKTRDLRIVSLVTGQVPVSVALCEEGNGDDPSQLVLSCAAAVNQAAACLTSVANVVSDGKVDRYDDPAIAEFEGHAAELLRLVPRTAATLRKMRDRAGG